MSLTLFVFCFFFFFKAEDGIRDLVRSRGLGDVYKREKEGRMGMGHTTNGKRRKRKIEWGGVTQHMSNKGQGRSNGEGSHNTCQTQDKEDRMGRGHTSLLNHCKTKNEGGGVTPGVSNTIQRRSNGEGSHLSVIQI